MKITDLEKKNAYLSIYSSAVNGLTQGLDDEMDNDDIDSVSNVASDLAAAGVESMTEFFSGGRRRSRNEEEEEEEEEDRPRRRGADA